MLHQTAFTSNVLPHLSPVFLWKLVSPLLTAHTAIRNKLQVLGAVVELVGIWHPCKWVLLTCTQRALVLACLYAL